MQTHGRGRRASGNEIISRAPSAGSSTSILPPCSVTIRQDLESPKPRPLPASRPGNPTKCRPVAARQQMAWVSTLDPQDAIGTEDEDLYAGRPTAAHIYQAMSLVPNSVKGFFDLVVNQYLPPQAMTDFDNEYRAISHAQIELVAGRVSALNQCVY